MGDDRIVLFGASVMAGFWDPEGGWFSRLAERYYRSGERKKKFYNCSISGDTTADLLERMETELASRACADR